MGKVQIVDLDGCISDDRWRRHLILPGAAQMAANKGFHTYHSLCLRDAYMNSGELLSGVNYAVMTSRPALYSELTRCWFRNNGLAPQYVFQRQTDDARPSILVKLDQLELLLQLVKLEDIVLAIDDREDILSMYKAHGIPTKLVRIGEEEHNEGR